MNGPQTETDLEDEIDLFAYFQIFWQRKWAALLIINCITTVTVIHTFLIADEVYEAKATIMPLKGAGGGPMSALKSRIPTGFAPFSLSQGVKAK